MSEQRIAACVICGDDATREELTNLVDSLKKSGVHGLFLAYNGTKGKTSLNWLRRHLKSIELPYKIEQFEWEEDFGKMRNYSLDMVPENEYDWMLWIDKDDTLIVRDGCTLQGMLADLDQYTTGVLIYYEYANDPDTGQCLVDQWRERFFKVGSGWRWLWPIHEVAAAQPGTQIARKEDCYIRHSRVVGEDRGARERNRKIIAKAIRDYPDEPRFVYYFAGETMDDVHNSPPGEARDQLAEAAIHMYRKFKDMVTEVNEDYFIAQSRIAEILRMKGDYLAAVDADLETIAIYPDWPDGYVGAAKSCMELGDWARMKAFAHMACQVGRPITVKAIEPLMAGFTPLFLRGYANEHLGEPEQALADYEAAREHWNPPDGSLDGRIEAVRDEIEEKAKEANGKSLRRTLRGTNPEKSICFFTQPILEEWHPKLLAETGAGGAETCIMRLAPRFVADGWRVAVFGTPGEHRGVHEGVEYWHAEEFLPSEPFTVFVSSRSPHPFKADLNARLKMLWMHDVNVGEDVYAIRDRPDVVLGLTNWHINHLRQLYGFNAKKMDLMPNGIETSLFDRDRSDDVSSEPRFVWSSSPDRGLETLLGLWPTIRSQHPGATLDIYYGWNMIDRSIQAYRRAGHVNFKLEWTRDKIKHQLGVLDAAEMGVVMHDRVPQEVLAERLYSYNYWPYTTDFCETFCITALEMQAAGVIPVASKLAALNETVAYDRFSVEGWPLNLDYQRRWLDALARAASDAPLGDEIRANARRIGREHAMKFSWDGVYSRWRDLLATRGI